MARIIKRLGFLAVTLTAFIILPFAFSSCKQVMGFGAAIDLEPPVLFVDSVPNPYYVRNEAILKGTVTDNVGMGRVVIRDATTQKEFGEATISGTRWEIKMTFTQKDNNTKISAEIVAWDRAGNSGDESVQFVNLYVDLTPPMFENPRIQRSDTRSIQLPKINELNELKQADVNNKQDVNKFQNGSFWITTDVVEEETYARTVTLFLYDENNDTEGQHVYKANFDNSNPFSPQWTIHEKDIVATSKAKSLNYEARLARGERIYLRVTLIATDLADNEATFGKKDKREDYGYLCLYRPADLPRARLAGGVGMFIPPGTEIPVDIFDDDSVEEAYVDLLTIDQFNSYGGNDTVRLANILSAIKANPSIVPTWRNFAYPGTEDPAAEEYEFFVNRKKGTENPPDLTAIVKTGSNSSDCGEYRLVAFVKDAKTAPHPASAAAVWNSAVYPFSLIDENAALIVVDPVITADLASVYAGCHFVGTEQVHVCGHPGHDLTPPSARYSSGDSPEDSTFPALTGGRYFTISGYTLDDITGGVTLFRMAWIPFGVSGGQESKIETVRRRLADTSNYPDGQDDLGVQYWTLEDIPGNSYFVTGYPQKAENTSEDITYQRKTFKKRFDVLGGPDDLISYNNFYYNGSLENNRKYFLLYAKNSKGNETYRAVQLLGNTNAPVIRVYDLTGLSSLGSIDSGLGPQPWPSSVTQTSTQYTTIKGQYDLLPKDPVTGDATDASLMAPSLRPYPPNRVYKIYAMAQGNKDVAIDSFTAEEIGTPGTIGYKPTTNSTDLTFVKPLTVLGQSTYVFKATNALGISAEIKKVILVTNTATLSSITASEPAGTYPGGETIHLRANFTALVQIRRPGGGTGPFLNIRYETGGPNTNSWKYVAIPFTGPDLNTETGFIEFDWEVPADANGRLQTVDIGYGDGGSTWNKPINVGDATILDYEGDSDAFLPGYNGDPWTNYVGNLQGSTPPTPAKPGKEIILDGRAPVITALYVGGKERYAPDDGKNVANLGTSSEWYYFNGSDTIEFEVYADKPIRNDAIPKIEFQVILPNATTPNPTWYPAEYLRFVTRAGQTYQGLMFAVTPGAVTGLPNDGKIYAIRLVNEASTSGKVVDMVGNRLDTADINTRFAALNKAIVIDKTPPPTAMPLLNGAAPVPTYSANPVLTITPATVTTEPWFAPGDAGSFKEYSLEDGANWTPAGETREGWTSMPSPGTITVNSRVWNLVVRHRDKAGNGQETNWSPTYTVDIEANFPKLLSVRVVQPRGIYKGGQTLDFVLEFERPVKANNANAYIVVADRNRDLTSIIWTSVDLSTASTFPGERDLIQIPVTLQTVNNKSSLTFSWNIKENSKNMTHGLTIAKINLAQGGGVVDLYGNPGGNTGDNTGVAGVPINVTLPSIIMPINNPPPPDAIDNLNGENHKVISFKPTLVESSSYPGNGAATFSGGNNSYKPGDTNYALYPEHARNLRIILTNRSQIKLVFSHDIRKEMGNIYIRPFTRNSFTHNYPGTGNVTVPLFPIPPYFPENETVAADGSILESFDSVLGRMTPTYQQYMRVTTQVAAATGLATLSNGTREGTGTSGTYLTTSDGKLYTTGQDYGPYRGNTQGLKAGSGYDGLGSGTSDLSWNLKPGYMVPDTTPKYVLDYRYRIDLTPANAVTTETEAQPFTSTTVRRRSSYLTDVQNIRAALYQAKFRWQTIDVNSPNVKIYLELDSSGAPVGSPLQYGTAVVIDLDSPLPSGMMWEIQFDDGCFVDEAINPVSPLNYGEYWFWTEGTQPPVIRVNRRSIDMRATANIISDPPKSTEAKNSLGVTANPTDDERGNLAAFNNIPFRVESETPGAHISYATYSGQGNNSIYIPLTLDGAAMGVTGTNWNARHAATPGTWVTGNLIRRSTQGIGASDTGQLYTHSGANWDALPGLQYTANGLQQNGQGNLWMFRSYNRDATPGQLSTAADGVPALSLGNKASSLAIRTTGDLIASKNYVVAQASVNGNTPVKGYEGIFVTLVALKNPVASGESGGAKLFEASNGNWPVSIYASNSLIPTAGIKGFPLHLNDNDLRYLKLPVGNSAGGNIYWVSTEIVSNMYLTFSSWQNSSDISARAFSLSGEVGAYLTGGYGDITYAFNYDQKHQNQ